MHRLKKEIMITQKLITIPGATLTGTDRGRVGGTMPSVASIGDGQALPQLNGAPASTNPLTNGSDSMSLPMFTPTVGYSDTGAVGH